MNSAKRSARRDEIEIRAAVVAAAFTNRKDPTNAIFITALTPPR